MVDIWLKPGDKVDKITHHRARGGTVIAEGDTLEEAIKLCNSIIEKNQISIKIAGRRHRPRGRREAFQTLPDA